MKSLFTTFIFLIVFISLVISSKYFWLEFVFFNTSSLVKTNIPNINIPNYTWSLDIEIYKKTLSEINSFDWKVRYILSFGKNWSEFFSLKTQPQSIKLWNTSDLNNLLLRSFLQKYQYKFEFSNTWYLIIESEKPVSKMKDILFALNWKTEWLVHQNLKYNFISDLSEDKSDQLYIFPINNIQIANWIGSENKKINFDLSNKIINIWFVIGENANSITNITYIKSLK